MPSIFRNLCSGSDATDASSERLCKVATSAAKSDGATDTGQAEKAGAPVMHQRQVTESGSTASEQSSSTNIDVSMQTSNSAAVAAICPGAAAALAAATSSAPVPSTSASGGSPVPAHPRKQRNAPISRDCQKQLEVVDSLYRKVLADERLQRFYDDADMARIFQSQMRVVTMMFGDKDVMLDQIQGLDLRKLHVRLLLKKGLSLEHWVVFVKHFKDTLNEATDIPDETRQRAIQLIQVTDYMFRPLEPGELERYGLDTNGDPVPGSVTA